MKDVIQNVYSPCNGVIEEVFVQQSSYVYEWEKLFLIKKSDGTLEEVAIGVSGDILSVEVKLGQEVNEQTLLCKLEDDWLITGCE
ncbi:hypothetical protein [Bacillus cereus group sp. BfR-BA-01380]|uniref:hypothetical protein n=1 Tax=Bacillus cereus group sp. BfR-BA-01380 TaxID=2920324 RepID=UPI001F5A8708|nr:hypothetical protein [Bacillus cereus group sp. BfR-BA-01380]